MILLQQPPAYSLTIYYIYRFSGEIITYLEIALLIWGIYKIKYFQGFYKFLLLNLCLATLLDIISLVTVKMNLTNNQPISHLYLLQETVTLGLFYFFTITAEKIKPIIKYSILSLCAYIIFNALWQQGYWQMPTKPAFIEQLIFTVLGMILYSQIFMNNRKNNLRSTPIFWFNLYVLITVSSTLIFFLIIESAMKMSDNVSMIIYTIKNVLVILCYIFWAIGVTKLRITSHQPHL